MNSQRKVSLPSLRPSAKSANDRASGPPGYGGHTIDINLLIDAEVENAGRVYETPAMLVDGRVRELKASGVGSYTAVRAADELLMANASCSYYPRKSI
jgi:hypothetical protein